MHRRPEISHEEFETTALMADRIADLGLDVHVRPQGTGFFADLAPLDFDPDRDVTVALRCDLDALEVTEATGADFASEYDGRMHACGHDVHMTCAFGAAMALAKANDQGALGGRVRVIYQHAEEAVGGAKQMIEFGAMAGVDYVVALHVDPELPVGEVGVRAGAFTAAFDEFHFVIKGRSGHGARPHHCVDPVFVLTQLANALYNAIGRSVDARDPMVLSIGKIAGGHAPNVIPDRAEMWGSIRTVSKEHRAAIEPLLVRIADGICATYGADYDLDLRRGAPAIVNDPTVTNLIADVAREHLGPNAVHQIPLPSMGSEDFSYFVEEAPGAMFRLGAWIPGQPRYFLHSAHFLPAHGAIEIGARMLAHTARQLMQRGKPA